MTYNRMRLRRRTDDDWLSRLRQRFIASGQLPVPNADPPDSPVTDLPDFRDVVAPDNLFRAFEKCRQDGGPAPGPEGLRFTDLGKREVWGALRALSSCLQQETWDPGSARVVKIPKADGGTRQLRLRSIFTRVVARATLDALAPFFETQVFLDSSFGFRAGRNTWQLLAELERGMREENRWVLVQADIRTAFDTVGVSATLQHFEQHGITEEMLRLVERILRKDRAAGDDLGIDQGCPMSGLALNVRLHHVHDLPLAMSGDPPRWLRYADNLVYLSHSVPEGERVLERVRNLFSPTEFNLKRGTTPIDLSQGRPVQLLGFKLRKTDGSLHLHLGNQAWTKLKESLQEVHNHPSPERKAEEVIHGWIGAYGPAFGGGNEETLDRLIRTAKQFGFEEIGTRNSLRRRLQRSYQAWLRVKNSQQRSMPQEREGSAARHVSGNRPAQGRPEAGRVLRLEARPALSSPSSSGASLIIPVYTQGGTMRAEGRPNRRARPQRPRIAERPESPPPEAAATREELIGQIRTLKRTLDQRRAEVVANYFQLAERLHQLKTVVNHGEWTPLLNELEFNPRTAARLMSLVGSPLAENRINDPDLDRKLPTDLLKLTGLRALDETQLQQVLARCDLHSCRRSELGKIVSEITGPRWQIPAKVPAAARILAAPAADTPAAASSAPSVLDEFESPEEELLPAFGDDSQVSLPSPGDAVSAAPELTFAAGTPEGEFVFEQAANARRAAQLFARQLLPEEQQQPEVVNALTQQVLRRLAEVLQLNMTAAGRRG